MEYRDELRQAILSGSGEEAPRRRFWPGRKSKPEAAAAPPPEVAAPVAAEVRPTPSPDFKKRAKWVTRTKKPKAEASPTPTRSRPSIWSAYSPLSILMRIAFAPVAAVAVGLSLYIAGSPFSPDMALGHLVAMGGCEPAAIVGLAPASVGDPGYHTPLDRDGNGVSCTPEDLAMAATDMPGRPGAIQSSGAKFIRP